MNAGTSIYKAKLNRTLRIILAMAMLFAAWHVTSHEIDISGEVGSHEECQLCLLSHIPIAHSPALAWFAPLLIFSRILILPIDQRPGQSFRYILGARAPPLS